VSGEENIGVNHIAFRWAERRWPPAGARGAWDRRSASPRSCVRRTDEPHFPTRWLASPDRRRQARDRPMKRGLEGPPLPPTLLRPGKPDLRSTPNSRRAPRSRALRDRGARKVRREPASVTPARIRTTRRVAARRACLRWRLGIGRHRSRSARSVGRLRDQKCVPTLVRGSTREHVLTPSPTTVVLEPLSRADIATMTSAGDPDPIAIGACRPMLRSPLIFPTRACIGGRQHRAARMNRGHRRNDPTRPGCRRP